MLLVHDPSAEEEMAMDGRILFFFNFHKELCSMTKLGGCSLPVDVILRATKLAGQRAEVLHERLAGAMSQLEEQCIADREVSLNNLRLFNSKQLLVYGAGVYTATSDSGSMDGVVQAGTAASAAVAVSTKGGIDRSDPILQWGNTHAAAVLREEE